MVHQILVKVSHLIHLRLLQLLQIQLRRIVWEHSVMKRPSNYLSEIQRATQGSSQSLCFNSYDLFMCLPIQKNINIQDISLTPSLLNQSYPPTNQQNMHSKRKHYLIIEIDK